MTALVVAGRANPPLAAAVAAALGRTRAPCTIERFPDGELRPVVGEVRGEDVYVVAPIAPPANEHLVELLLLLDACRRAGAGRTTAVVPYFAYARQDRRVRSGEALGARVVADALAASGAERLVVVDPHTAALEAMCPMPVETLSAVPVLSAGLAGLLTEDTVLVAPDLGAVKLAERYARRLSLPVAVVRKVRVSGTEVRAHELVGEVTDRPSVVVDDMISTGATIEAAARVLRAHGARDGVSVAATHGVLAAGAAARLSAVGSRILLTDTLRPPEGSERQGGLVEVCTVAPLLAEAIRRLHEEAPLGDLGPEG